MRVARVKLPRPHSIGQKELIESQTNDVVFCGRRWGKTHSGVQRLVRSALINPDLYWWVALGWKSASCKHAWSEMKKITAQTWLALDERPDKYIREASKEVHLPGGGEIWLRTAERPESLAGASVRGAVVDEFTLMNESVWTEYLEGCLLDKSGWVMFTGVPKGNNWGARLWRRAAHRPGWRDWHFPTRSNPLLPEERYQDIRLNTPERMFRQEYLAEIVDFDGKVFTNFEACALGTRLSGALDGHSYVMGLDWGKNLDYTVASIFDANTMQQVFLDRFNTSDYTVQLDRIRDIYTRFIPYCIVAENNTLGEPLCDQLIKDGLPIKRFYTTNASKREIIEALQVDFEQQRIVILNDPDFNQELEEYEARTTSFGNIQYNAPDGGHDDIIMATALVWDEIRYDSGISL